MDSKIKEKISKIKIVVLDVDGVLTDGKIILSDNGHESKNFNVRDGHALRLLMRYGIDVMLLTGRTSEVVKLRAKDLGITNVYQGVWNKLEKFAEVAKSKSISFDEVCYVGDDIVDVPLLRRVGFSCASADAQDDVKAVVDFITLNNGGGGAVREISELLLKEKGLWAEVATHYEL